MLNYSRFWIISLYLNVDQVRNEDRLLGKRRSIPSSVIHIGNFDGFRHKSSPTSGSQVPLDLLCGKCKLFANQNNNSNSEAGWSNLCADFTEPRIRVHLSLHHICSGSSPSCILAIEISRLLQSKPVTLVPALDINKGRYMQRIANGVPSFFILPVWISTDPPLTL